MERKLRQRIDLQQTHQKQMEYKAMRMEAQLAEEEVFKKQVRACRAGVSSPWELAHVLKPLIYFICLIECFEREDAEIRPLRFYLN